MSVVLDGAAKDTTVLADQVEGTVRDATFEPGPPPAAADHNSALVVAL